MVAIRFGVGEGWAEWLQPAVSSVGMSASLPDKLLEARDRGLLVPFVGAGVSMAVKRRDGTWAFPSWPGLLARAAERLEREGRPECDVVRAMLKVPGMDLVEVGKHAERGLRSLRAEFLRDCFDLSRDTIDPDTLELAVAVWGLGSRLVITTNYDRARVADLGC